MLPEIKNQKQKNPNPLPPSSKKSKKGISKTIKMKADGS